MSTPVSIEEPARSTLRRNYRDGVLQMRVDRRAGPGVTVVTSGIKGEPVYVLVPDEAQADEVRRCLLEAETAHQPPEEGKA